MEIECPKCEKMCKNLGEECIFLYENDPDIKEMADSTAASIIGIIQAKTKL